MGQPKYARAEETPNWFVRPASWDAMRPFQGTYLQIEFDGLTGPVKFKDGQRSTLKLDILKLRPEGLVKVGEWRQDKGINVSTEFAFYHGRAPNITLRVTTMLVCCVSRISSLL